MSRDQIEQESSPIDSATNDSIKASICLHADQDESVNDQLGKDVEMKYTVLPIADAYSLWSSFYDHYPNALVTALDIVHFPLPWIRAGNYSVLDVGCGTGKHLELLMDQGNMVTGIDLCVNMIAIADKRLSGRAELITGNFLLHDFGSLRFDAIIGSMMLEHLTVADLPLFFIKAASLLNRNGQVLVAQPNTARAHFRLSDSTAVYTHSYMHSPQILESLATVSGLQLLEKHSIMGDLVAETFDCDKYSNRSLITVWQFIWASSA